MTRRLILCEGPDDVAALRTLGRYVFQSEIDKTPWSSGATGEARKVVLRAGGARVDITAAGTKSVLAALLADALKTLQPQADPLDESTVTAIAVVFDPDDQGTTSFYEELAAAVAAGATSWKLEASVGTPGSWVARRDEGEELLVRAIAWHAPGAVVDGLPDNQNLERLLCAVAARTYPAEATLVESWLTEIGRIRTKAPKWKAALHLWCALVDESASETNAAARFFHDHKKMWPQVSDVLREVGLLEELRPLLGPS